MATLATAVMLSDGRSSGSGSGSSTTIITVRDYRDFKIIGYSRRLNADDDIRPVLNSAPFCLGGRTWQASYRPMGSPEHKDSNTDSISFYVSLLSSVDKPARVQITLSVLDYHGDPVPDGSRTTVMQDNTKMFGFERFIEREYLRECSTFFKDDCLVLRLRIHDIKEVPSIVVPPSNMQQHIGNLLATKEHTDVEFQVSGETFLAHRLVLATRSPVFRAELYGPMKEGTTPSIVQVDDIEAQVFEALLAFIYTDEWPQMEQEEESSITQHLLVAADKYGLQRLKLICEDRLCKHIDKGNIAIILALAEKHHCRSLKQACFEFLNTLTAPFEDIDMEGFEYLAQVCPALMKYLVDIALARGLKKSKISKEIRKEINNIDGPPTCWAKSKHAKQLLIFVCAGACWLLWKTKNDLVLEDNMPMPTTIANKIVGFIMPFWRTKDFEEDKIVQKLSDASVVCHEKDRGVPKRIIGLKHWLSSRQML